MLGRCVARELARAQIEFDAPSRQELRFDAPDCAWNWIVNCAAYTAVDRAEQEPDLAHAANVELPKSLAQLSKRLGAGLIHISTDFVFDGAKGAPYTPEDAPNPQSTYGRTKFEGEQGILEVGCEAWILRTAWLFGPDAPCFPRTIIQRWSEGAPLRVVADQFGCPTYAPDLAAVIVAILGGETPPGTYHAAGPVSCSWHAFAVRACEAAERLWQTGRPAKIEAIRTEDWPTPAVRPKNSTLDSSGLLRQNGIPPMRPPDEALDDFVRTLPRP